MNVAQIIPTEQRTAVPKKAAKTPPPLTDESVSSNVTNYEDSNKIRKWRRGQEVEISTQRYDRRHFDGHVGTVAAVIFPSDPSRSIIYVRVGKASPCFYAHELHLVAKAGEVAV